MLFFLQAYPILGTLTTIALIVAYISFTRNETYWLRVEIMMAVTFSALLPFSSQLCKLWLGGNEGDLLSKSLFTLLILGIITRGVTFYFTRDTKNQVVKTSLASANIISRGGLFLIAAHALIYVKGFHPLALQGDCTVGALCLLGDLVNFRKLTDKDVLMINGRVKYCALFDAIASLCAGFFLLVFPYDVATFLAGPIQVTGVQVKLLRNFGFEISALALLSFGCLYYKKAKDVASVLKAKLVVYVPVLIGSAWYYVTAVEGLTSSGLATVGAAALILEMNCLIAQLGTGIIKMD